MNFIYVGVLNYSATFRVYSLLQRQLQLIRIRTAILASARERIKIYRSFRIAVS